MQLKGLEITEIYDNNGQYANPNVTFKDADGKTIQLYKGSSAQERRQLGLCRGRQR